MASANRTFFFNDITFRDIDDEGRDGLNNDMTFRDQNYAAELAPELPPADAAAGERTRPPTIFPAPNFPSPAGGYSVPSSYSQNGQNENGHTPSGFRLSIVDPVYPAALPDLTFMDDQRPSTHPSRHRAPLPPADRTGGDFGRPQAVGRSPADPLGVPMGPRTPMPQMSPEEEAWRTGAKRKTTAGSSRREDSPRTKHMRRGEGGMEEEANESSMNASSDIDAMIRLKRTEMQRTEAMHKEQTRTLESLVPIVCNAGNVIPENVKFAALHSLSQMITQKPSLVEELLRQKPNILKHFDAITYGNPDKEQVLVDIFKMVSVMASNFLTLVLSGENDKYFKHLLKRFIKCQYQDLVTNAKQLVENCKT